MYNHHLTTFIQVADCGSFMKAGEKMYISGNAVTKQINLLEQHLEVKLFHRSTQGLSLTKAGELVYQEAKSIILHSESVLQKARALEEHQITMIRVGISLMNTGKILLDQWEKAAKLYPNIKLQIVPFEDTNEDFFDILDHFGQKIDIIPCASQSSLWDNRCNSFHLCELPFCIAVAKDHRLAAYPKLSVSDLYGEKVVMGVRGVANSTDRVRAELMENHPQVEIQDVEVYGYNLFNEIAASNLALLSAECWSDVHPLLVTIPVDWEFTISYGLIYPSQPTKEVLDFIMAIGKVNI